MSQAPYAGLDAVVFDLDGTLVDSAPDIAAAANVALRHAGLDALPLDAIIRMVGNGSEVLIERALTAAAGAAPSTDRVADVHADFLAAYAAAPCVATRLYPGTRDVLDSLRSAGVKLGICTNKPQDITAQVLDALDLTSLFDAVVGGSSAHPLKPAPEMLLQALHDLSVSPGRSVMVGDSRADAGAARAAGVRLVLLRHGYSNDDLDALGADAVLPDFAGFLDSLLRMTPAPA